MERALESLAVNTLADGQGEFALEEFFTSPIVDMGDQDHRFRGIYMPASEVGSEKIGITHQFLDNAQEYDALYSSTPYFRSLFDRVFDVIHLNYSDKLRVLDIGAGSGANSAIPIINKYPESYIISTDLSPDLLAVLRKYVLQEGLQSRIHCVCTDAMKNHFVENEFDLVVGSAILHHLINPIEALTAASRALKPGGVAIFFEPFEGFALLRTAFELILAQREEVEPLDQAVAALLQALATDFRVRAEPDRTADHFRHMDDKWLFTRSYFERARLESGFSSISIIPLQAPEAIFHRMTGVLLRMGGGFEERDLPNWAWEYVDMFDRNISDDLKVDLVMEGAVVFRK